MAKGADSEEFALLSGPRTGLKREFAFALKSQTEVSGSYGRTRGRRSGNSPFSDGDMEGSSRKRFKSSIEEVEEEDEQKKDVNEVLDNEEPLNDSIKSPCNEDEEPLNVSCREESMSDLDKTKCDELPQSDSLKCSGLKSPRTEEPNNNGEDSCMEEGTGSETPIMIDNKSVEHNAVMEKPLKRFTRSALKSKEEQNTTDEGSMVNSASPEKPMRMITRSVLGSPNAEKMVTDGNGQVDKSLEKAQNPCTGSRSGSEHTAEQIEMDESRKAQNSSLEKPCDPSVSEPTAEPMVVDGNREVENPSQEKTPKHLTHAALEPKEDQMVKDDTREVHKASQEKTPKRFTRAALVKDDSREVHNTPPEKTPRRFTRSALEPQSDHMVMDENCEVQTASLEKPCHASVSEPTAEQLVLDGNKEVENPSREKTPKRFTRAALEPKEGQMVKDDSGEVHNASQEKSPKRFTRAALVKAEQMAKDDSREVHNTSPEKTPRRFTPSIMEPKAELMVITENSDQLNALSETPTRRFTRSALESNTDPLVVDDNKNPQDAPSEEPASRFTHSVLKPKAESIVMSNNCDLPNALPAEPVRRIRFTRSALKPKEEQLEISAIVTTGGSSTISEESCKSETELLGAKNKLEMKMSKKIAWPLDTLETTLQNAIGSSPVNDSTICVICKGHLPSDFRKALQICDSCLEAKKTQGTTARTIGTHARLSKPVMTPGSLSSALVCAPSQNKSIKGKITRKDLRLHKLVFEEDGLPDGTELAYYMRGKKLLEGYKKGFGIFCRCCNSEVSASTFEAHAGCASRRKPFHQIYTSNGVSLHELSISLSKVRKFSSNDNDDLCGICGDGGNLLLCDGCPRAFHKDCVGQSSIPQGKWYCPYCQKIFEQEQPCANNENAKAAGRISGVDPMEEISKRCIRIVKTIEPDVGGCALCRCHSFCRVGFGPRTVILCDQCEKEFHVGCLKDHNMADLKELPKGEWFCRPECNRIHSVLQKLIIRGSEELPDSILCVIKGKLEGKNLNSDAGIDVRWRLLNGKVATPESRSLLSKAVTIFHDRFDPIVDSTTGRDLIPSMVYGRKKGDQEYGGMYCAVLTVNSFVVSAGILRIFGQEIAELPLVATSADYQGQGYFQSLFCCIERLLGFLNVKNLVLPAAEEAEAIWTNKFGFEKISNDQLSNYRKHCQMTIFQGTSMLQKPVPKCRVVDRPKKDS